MNTRFLLVCGALILLAHGVLADGIYQRTKDRKIQVWNDDPKAGDVATWSGEKDEEGYATGYGTLVWYSARQDFLTGSRIPSKKVVLFGRYSGKMVRGKFEGSVKVDSKGKIAHANFVEGKRTGEWASQPASTRSVVEKRSDSVQQETVVEPAPPAAGPSAAAVADPSRDERVHRDTIVETPPQGPAPAIVPEAKQPMETAANRRPSPSNEALRSLFSPPSGLRTSAEAEAPQPSPAPVTSEVSAEPSVSAPVTSISTGPRLAATEVVELANAEARKQGYDMGEYQHGEAQHAVEADKWTISYEQESLDRNGMGRGGKRFTVSVDDKTKKASIAPQE